MNYIELINYFWGLDETWQFGCCETRLYFYLVKTANRLGWPDSWTHSDVKTSANVGVSVNSFKAARNKLVQAGLIKFIAGGKHHGDKTRYQILIPNSIPNPTPNLIPNSTPNHEPLNKLNKTKLNNTSPKPPEGDLTPNKKEDFIDQVIQTFTIRFLQIRGLEYEITNKGKERSAASKILQIYKKKYPEADTGGTLEGLGNYFQKCLEISDDWLNQNMSLPLIINKFNEINNILAHGNKRTTGKQHAATTDQELAGIFAKHFATDYPRQ